MIKRLIFFVILFFSFVIPVQALPTPTRLGVNYNYYGTSFHDGSYLETLDNPGVRIEMQSHLAYMAQEGVKVVRFMVRFRRAKEGNGSLFVPSATGAIPHPYRQRFINILTDIDSAGMDLIVSMVPTLYNDPMQSYGFDLNHPYDANRFSENWSFFQDVRMLSKQYGPNNVEFDLINEGAPWDTMEVGIRNQTTAYDTQIIQLYADTYGSLSDACITFTGHDISTLRRLIEIHSAAGSWPSKWCTTFYPQPYPNVANTLSYLNEIDALLTLFGRSEPISIQETYYNNRYIAVGLEKFILQSSRPIADLIAWPILGNSSTLVPAPYNIGEYVKFLNFSSNPNLPFITVTSLITSNVPWKLQISGTNIGPTIRARIYDIDGAQWSTVFSEDITIENSKFRLPDSVPPSRCNILTSCTLTYQLLTLDGRTTPITSFVLPAINTPILYASVWTGLTPYFVVFTYAGTVFGNEKAYLVDSDGSVWAERSLVYSGTGSYNFQLPSNIPPSGCNLGTTCTIYFYLSGNGFMSKRYPIILPVQ